MVLRPLLLPHLLRSTPQRRLFHVEKRIASIPLLRRVFDESRADKVAVINTDGSEVTYRALAARSTILARTLRAQSSGKPTIACFQVPGSSYVETMLATWLAGKRFLPLQTTHPLNELRYFVDDADCAALLFSSKDESLNSSSRDGGDGGSKHSFSAVPLLGVPVIDTDGDVTTTTATTDATTATADADADAVDEEDALVLYTSGTTGRPKGVVHNHLGVAAQTRGLCAAWKYTQQDHVLHFLPLHHMHGVLNNLLCPLWAGGTVEFLPSAAPQLIFRRLADESQASVSMLFGVPTVYARLLQHVREPTPLGHRGPSSPAHPDWFVSHADMCSLRSDIRTAVPLMRAQRVHTCGSAALPQPLMEAWGKLSGHVLLERYGMTELGMCLSNTIEEGGRMPGHVGKTLPGVDCKIVDDAGKEVPLDLPASQKGTEGGADTAAGELRVKGKSVFNRYLGRPQATAEAFDEDGWFRTGDVAVYNSSLGAFRILGRASADIIKMAGYKLSSLEIERELLSYAPLIECAVLGVPDATLGEALIAVLVIPGATAEADQGHREALAAFLEPRLASYKRRFRHVFFVSEIPRNAMGKVNKKSLLGDLGLEQRAAELPP